MLSVLIEGTLIAAPVQRTSAKGSQFVTAQLRCHAEDGESVFCSVIAFSASAAEALARLAAGDTVAVTGPAALSQWEKDGQHKVGLTVTATRVLTVYDAGMRRKAASQAQQDREPQAEREPQRVDQAERPGRNQYGRRREPDRQPPARFDDDDGPV